MNKEEEERDKEEKRVEKVRVRESEIKMKTTNKRRSTYVQSTKIISFTIRLTGKRL